MGEQALKNKTSEDRKLKNYSFLSRFVCTFSIRETLSAPPAAYLCRDFVLCSCCQ